MTSFGGEMPSRDSAAQRNWDEELAWPANNRQPYPPLGKRVLRPRDRCRTITPLLLVGILPEPVHAALSEAKISAITHFARVPGKELPQEAPSSPVPVCPPPARADPHDAHPHPGFTMRQHSAHIDTPPAPHDATALRMEKIGQF